MTPEAMRVVMPSVWSAESSTRWQADNPALGQCGVTALLVQKVLGGEILKTKLGGTWHFYNRIDGRRHDLTDSQFPSPIGYDDVIGTRDEAWADGTPSQHAALHRAWRRATLPLKDA